MSLLPLLLVACAPDASSERRSTACEAVATDDVEAVTTLTRRLVPDPGLEGTTELNPALPEGLREAERLGLGGATKTIGEARQVRDTLAPGHGRSAGSRSLAMIFHQSDAQIADVESPTRVVGLDDPSATQSAARPQEIYALHTLDALIRTANLLSEHAPIDFAMVTGDNADSNQDNELGWFIDTFDGTSLLPDAGTPGSQLDEDCNDPVARFTPTGADFPWYSVAGNHDVLVQGNFAPEDWREDALGGDARIGTRDLSLPGAPLVYATDPDPARRLLVRSDIAALYLSSPTEPPGHGFTDANVTDDTVSWVAHPIPGAPLAVLAIDANPSGPGDARISLAERDGFLAPALAAAGAAGELVVLTSHYALGGLAMEGGGRLGDWLQQYPQVVLSLVGHSHLNRIESYGPAGDAGAFWEIETCSSNDWPAQARLVELVVNEDGTLSVLTTMFDAVAPPGSLAARASTLARIDLQSGWRLGDGSGEPEDRNTELVQVLPEGFAWSGGHLGARSDDLP